MERYTHGTLKAWRDEEDRFILVRAEDDDWRLYAQGYSTATSLRRTGILDIDLRWARRAELLADLGEACRAVGIDPPSRMRRTHKTWMTLDGMVHVYALSEDDCWKARARLSPEAQWTIEPPRGTSFSTRGLATEWAREAQRAARWDERA